MQKTVISTKKADEIIKSTEKVPAIYRRKADTGGKDKNVI